MKKPMTKRQAFNLAQKQAKKQIKKLEKQIQQYQEKGFNLNDYGLTNKNLSLRKKLTVFQTQVNELEIKAQEERQKLFEASAVQQLNGDEKNKAMRMLYKLGIVNDNKDRYMEFLFENEEKLDFEEIKKKSQEYLENQNEISDATKSLKDNPYTAFY